MRNEFSFLGFYDIDENDRTLVRAVKRTNCHSICYRVGMQCTEATPLKQKIISISAFVMAANN